jgi:RHS repeat-associated protein
MPPLSQSLRFFHTDHLGSASWVTGYTGSALQHLQYLPFGEPWVSQTSNSYEGAKYTFSGKERDKETGLMYFGARYYNPEYGIWNQVDPLHAKYPYQSPFVYCANNPLKYVDPNGKDEWEVNQQGKVVNIIQNDKKDQFHVVNNEGKRIASSDAFETQTFSIQTNENEEGKTLFKTSDYSSSESDRAFAFMANNTNVEWSNVRTNKGTFLGSSQEEKSTIIMGMLFDAGYEIISSDHNHPSGIPLPSQGKSYGDIPTAKAIQQKYPNATFNIYVKGRGYFPYNKDGILWGVPVSVKK